MTRTLRYVGSAEVASAAAGSAGGMIIRRYADLAAWCTDAGAEVDEPFTYVVGLDGLLRLTPRRSEHVACASGQEVLAAGEVSFVRDGTWKVSQVSNLSTGYCPDLDSWIAVADALDLAGITHPGRFTDEVVFRRCDGCGERNLVKDEVFCCAICDADLPARWNFADRPVRER